MATSVTSPAYLPQYQRQVIGARNVQFNTGGFVAQARSAGALYGAQANLADAVAKIAQNYAMIREVRDTRDTETLIEQTIRQRSLDVFTSRQGKDADGILQDEEEWARKTKEEIAEKSGLSNFYSGAMWDKAASGYLNRVTSYAIEQNKVAEAESKENRVLSAQENLMLSAPGDIAALAQYAAIVESTYGKGTGKNIKYMENGMELMFDTWVASDPSATVKWFKENKNKLLPVFGRYYADAVKAYDKAANRLDAQAQRAHNQAMRNEARAAKERDKMSTQWEQDGLAQYYAWVTGVEGAEEFDVMQYARDGYAKGVNGKSIDNLLNIIDRRDAKMDKAESLSIVNEMILAINNGTFDTVDAEGNVISGMVLVNQLTADAKLSVKDNQAIVAAYSKAKKAEQKAVKDNKAIVLKAIRTAVAPTKDVFSKANPQSEARCLQEIQKVENQVDVWLGEGKDSNFINEQLDITNPNSWASRRLASLSEGNTGMVRMTSSFDTGAIDWTQGQDDSKKAKPGESLDDYDKRVGGQ